MKVSKYQYAFAFFKPFILLEKQANKSTNPGQTWPKLNDFRNPTLQFRLIPQIPDVHWRKLVSLFHDSGHNLHYIMAATLKNEFPKEGRNKRNMLRCFCLYEYI